LKKLEIREAITSWEFLKYTSIHTFSPEIIKRVNADFGTNFTNIPTWLDNLEAYKTKQASILWKEDIKAIEEIKSGKTRFHESAYRWVSEWHWSKYLKSALRW
jgi:predicted  nucleic acid-binding Zn ribbon protein